jgi:DNA-binding transcriptional LysR family regulator
MPTIRMLKTFRAVARTGSFAAAADKVALTQAAVSLQMRGLEQALGRQLFDRSARQITLSRQGHEIRPKVEQILDLLDELEATSTLTSMQGPVAIGAVVSVIQALSLGVARLKTAHPWAGREAAVGPFGRADGHGGARRGGHCSGRGAS